MKSGVDIPVSPHVRSGCPMLPAIPVPPEDLTFLALTLTYELLDGPVTDPHPGSVWHGTWGKAVDLVACAVRQATCHGCWMIGQCPAVALANAKQGPDGPVAEAVPMSRSSSIVAKQKQENST